MKFHSTVEPAFIRACWKKAGLLTNSEENDDNSENEIDNNREDDEEVALVRELSSGLENMLMVEESDNDVAIVEEPTVVINDGCQKVMLCMSSDCDY